MAYTNFNITNLDFFPDLIFFQSHFLQITDFYSSLCTITKIMIIFAHN